MVVRDLSPSQAKYEEVNTLPIANRNVKSWLAITLVSLIVWLFYWLSKTPSLPASYISNLGIVFWAGLIGQVALFTGAILGLIGIFLSLSLSKPFAEIRSLIAATVFSAGVYYLGFLPSVYWLTRPGTIVYSPFLGAAYLLQALLTAPFFMILALKVKKYNDPAQMPSLLKWAGLAFLGFTGALWANAVMRWFDMLFSPQGGIAFLLSGIRALGFFNAVIFMSLAVVFAAFACHRLVKKNTGSATKLFGLSLTMIGIQYALLLVYAQVVNAWALTLLIDVWTAPFLGLGAALLIAKTKQA
ncbi:MAG: hypothetical protein NWE94_10375 [Candidatus Bathyarchaeota archaeon]|nr:hypothetical protein [Candidatus Bathyarchaeota archaeon]